MKKIIAFLCSTVFGIYLYSSSIRAQSSVEFSDTIKTDVIWSADTIKVTGNIVVIDDVTLTIEPGTIVQFQGYYHMVILGTINAIGTENNMIVFTVSDTMGFSNFESTDGSWNGMIFNNGTGWGGADGAMNDNDTSRLTFCLIEYTKAIPSTELVWSPIEVNQFSRLVISECEICFNYTFSMGGAIRLYTGSDFAILSNYIHHNIASECGGGIFSNQSAPVITGNNISNNTTTTLKPALGKGGGLYIAGMNPVIYDNIIQDNKAIYGAGIFMTNSFGIIENNIIAHNTGYGNPPDLISFGGGIFMEQTSAPLIRNNKISNNYAHSGGGIYFIDSQPEIINNLIVNNTGSDGGGALYGWDSYAKVINNTISRNKSPNGPGLELTNTRIEFINNILWDNGGYEIHLQDRFAHLDLKNSVLQDGEVTFWGAGTYSINSMIEEDPYFVKPSSGIGENYEGLVNTDWRVAYGSPCINAGLSEIEDFTILKNDLAGNKRIQHSLIDIGAYETYIPSITVHDTIKTNTTWIADTVKITGDVTINDNVILTILPGTYVEFQDTFSMHVNGTIIAKGNSDNLIIFTIADTAGFYDNTTPNGGWGGIIFDNSYEGMNNDMADNDSSLFSYCQLNFAKAIHPDNYGGALRLKYYSKVRVSDCVFANNIAGAGGGAIYLNRSSMKIENCYFFNNSGGSQGGGAILTEQEVKLILKNSTFENNNTEWRGGAVNLYASADAAIDHNIFINNRAQHRGGAIYLRQTPGVISNNLLTNNYSGESGGGISLQEKNNQLYNNVITNNTSNGAGGGVYLLYENILTANNTICNNTTNTGGGAYNAFSNHRSYNDILYGNDCSTYGKQYGLITIQVSLEFRNCNIEGGTENIGIWTGDVLEGIFTDIIDSFPHFNNPSVGPGILFNGISSDWTLKSISPCINAGTTEGIDNFPVNTDIAGNQRIFADVIDIGAYENQDGLPEITLQPLNQITCAGEQVSIIVRTKHESFFQWQKNGTDIEGASNNEYFIESVSPEDDGNYQCIVRNSFGSAVSIPVYLIARSSPEIILQPLNTWAVEGEGTVISTIAEGTSPLQYKWFKDGTRLLGERYPDLRILSTSLNHEGEYYCQISNACGEVQTNSVQLYLSPQICMVTVDTVSGNNLVIWEKTSNAPLESYNIYRESVVAGEYEIIGNIPADNLSVYEDTIADPFIQSYIYKITAVDNIGNESDIKLCKPHRTIHLLTSINTEVNSIQCDWNHYYGFDYGTYVIYRGIKGSSLDSVYSISRSFSTWIDRSSIENIRYIYRVAARRIVPCYPAKNKKADSGPYSHSMSNIEDNRFQTGIKELNSSGNLTIYPNPSSDQTTVSFPNPEQKEYRLTVRDLSGKMVLIVNNITDDKVIIESGSLKSGYYSVEVVGDRIYRAKLIIE